MWNGRKGATYVYNDKEPGGGRGAVYSGRGAGGCVEKLLLYNGTGPGVEKGEGDERLAVQRHLHKGGWVRSSMKLCITYWYRPG